MIISILDPLCRIFLIARESEGVGVDTMWESQKVYRQSNYQDLDHDHLIPRSSSSSRGRTNNLLATLVGVLGLASILGLSAMTYRSLNPQETVVVIPVLNVDEAEEMKIVPVLDITSGGGWGGAGQRVGGLPPPDTPDPKWDPEPSDSELGLFDYAAVSVDSIPCAGIGKYAHTHSRFASLDLL